VLSVVGATASAGEPNVAFVLWAAPNAAMSIRGVLE